jgi:hypothetical protein
MIERAGPVKGVGPFEESESQPETRPAANATAIDLTTELTDLVIGSLE